MKASVKTETFRDYEYIIDLISCWNEKNITLMIILNKFDNLCLFMHNLLFFSSASLKIFPTNYNSCAPNAQTLVKKIITIVENCL